MQHVFSGYGRHRIFVVVKLLLFVIQALKAGMEDLGTEKGEIYAFHYLSRFVSGIGGGQAPSDCTLKFPAQQSDAFYAPKSPPRLCLNVRGFG